MDANQTLYKLVLGRDNWAECIDDSGAFIFASPAEEFSWNAQRSEVTLGVRLNVFHSAPGNVAPDQSDRRGAAQDRFGNLYWIADSRTELLVNSVGDGVTTHFWSSTDEISAGCRSRYDAFVDCGPPAPSTPLSFSGLAITTEHYLIAGVRNPAGFVVFDLFHGGPPRQVAWPPAIPFAPFAMAAAPDGGVWILDQDNARLWELDRTFAVAVQKPGQAATPAAPPEIFRPADSSPPGRPQIECAPAIAVEMAADLSAIKAIAMAVLPDNSVLLLESSPANPFSSIYRFRSGDQLGEAASLSVAQDLLAPADRAGFTLRGFDLSFIAAEQTPEGARQNITYVVGENGDQAWAFTTAFSTDQLALTPIAEYYPMRMFGGIGLIAGETQVFYDSRDIWAPLVMQKRPRYAESGVIFTQVFDARQPDCVWHRLVMDAAIPGDAVVRIYSRAANDRSHLSVQQWAPEPAPYPRDDGPELPWVTEAAGLSAWELLFQQAVGQYLQLKIAVSGNGKITPRLRALRIYYPRFSYRDHYLPAVYRQDQRSASFVERFLANFEGFYTALEDRIATVQTLLDARSTPAEALAWLANWFGVALDPAWTEAQRRLFLKNAAMFFEARGTVPGLIMALRLALEDCADPSIFQPSANVRAGIRIVERFRTRRLPTGMLEDPQAETGLPIKPQTSMWTPAQGAADLDQRYSAAQQLPPGTQYPISMPSNDGGYAAWTVFSTATLGFIPAAPGGKSSLWPAFLSSRYGVISELNSTYSSSYATFFDVPFPEALPRQAQPLLDWYQFQGILLVGAAAHQFTVYLPLAPGDAQNTNAQRAKMSLAERVIELEKPAHATYEVKFYWAFFRVGDARLGDDTVLDQSSRATQLLLPAVLGDTYTGSTYLARQLPGEPRYRPFLKRSCLAP